MMGFQTSAWLLAAFKHDLFMPSSPAVVIALLAAMAAAAWVGLHFLRLGRLPAVRWALLPVRLALGYIALSLLFQVLQRGLVLTTSWALWPIALGGAACVELIVAFYRLERRTVSRRTGFILMGLRLALLLLAIIMLAQPVRSLDISRRLQRFVAVLVDNSASMHVPETQLTDSEKVRLAEMLGVEKRPYPLDTVHQKIVQARQDLAARHEHLVRLRESKGDIFTTQLADYADKLLEALRNAQKTVTAQADAIEKTIRGKLTFDSKLLAELLDIKTKLQVQAHQRLDDAVKIAEHADSAQLARSYDTLKNAVAQASVALAEQEDRLAAAAVAVDAVFLKALPADRRARVAAVADKTRYVLARDVLLSPLPWPKGAKPASLVERIGQEYEVRVYSFASTASEVNLEQWAKAPTTQPADAAASQPATQPASAPAGAPSTEERMRTVAALPVEQQETNLAAALQQVITDMKGKELAGVIVLSDGRQNAGERVEILARDLGIQKAPICPIVFGSDRAPCDAAVVNVEAPETVYTQDRVYVKADIKLDALAGQSIKLTLWDGKRQVDQTTVDVPHVDRFRKQVQLSDEPKEAGMHAYRLEIDPSPGEVFTTNNEYPFTVSVSNDQTRLLLVDGRPRWEYRYLKNLFDMRDRSVRLQHVLLEPDRIAGQDPPPEIHASAARPPEQTEATALPKDLAEWLKFDVIILGDVDPRHLGDQQIDALRRFVFDRGGSLIVIAGPIHMPRSYAGTVIEEMLPATLPPPADLAGGVPMEGAFRIALTAEGQDNVIMRQEVDPKENLRVWNSLPDIYWRHPIREARPAATVLAYAMPPNPPDAIRTALAREQLDQDLHDQLRRFQRERALLMFQNVGMGKVMFFSFDHTWRLRYRVGDTYHHRLWGQVLRWATANKLPAGTDLVKIGTDRSRYSPRTPVTVRAKIVQEDFSPLRSDEVRVNVFNEKDGSLVLWRKLEFVPDSPGVYIGELTELPSGSFRVELDAPAAKPLLARDNVDKVATVFSIDPAAPTEQIELAADRGLLGRLATLSGGRLVDPPQAAAVMDVLGTDSVVEREHRDYFIWNSWPLLVLMVLVAAVEWILRKKAGLA